MVGLDHPPCKIAELGPQTVRYGVGLRQVDKMPQLFAFCDVSTFPTPTYRLRREYLDLRRVSYRVSELEGPQRHTRRQKKPSAHLWVQRFGCDGDAA